MLKIKLLKANRGDCIILEFGDVSSPHYIIIDSGIGKQCTRELKLFLEKVKKSGQKIDLIILTHYDADHINGFLSLMKYKIINSDFVKGVWMNYGNELSKAVGLDNTLQFNISEASCETSVAQGKDFYEYLCENGINLNAVILSGDEIDIEDTKIRILSPSPVQIKKMLDQIIKIDSNVVYPYNISRHKETARDNSDFQQSIDEILKKEFVEDRNVANCSSIAFLFEYKDYKLLLLGDSAPSQIVNALQLLGYSKEHKLKLNFCKLSHHGSNHNTSDELIEHINCQNYIISSDWNGDRPGKECLCRVVVNNEVKTTFYCNYPHKDVFKDSELEQYNISFEDIGDQEIILEE